MVNHKYEQNIFVVPLKTSCRINMPIKDSLTFFRLFVFVIYSQQESFKFVQNVTVTHIFHLFFSFLCRMSIFFDLFGVTRAIYSCVCVCGKIASHAHLCEIIFLNGCRTHIAPHFAKTSELNLNRSMSVQYLK